MDGTTSRSTGQVDLGDLIAILWRGKWIIAAVATLVVAIAVVVAMRMPNVYRSEAVLKPVEDSGGSLPGGSGLAALGTLAGINVGSGGVSSTDAAIAVLQSRRFLVDFARRTGMTVDLMAGVEWDSEQQRLLLDPDVYDARAKRWLRPVSGPWGREPSDEEIYRKFRSILKVERDPATQLVTVSITYVAPDRAHRWAGQLVRDLNAELRRQRIAQADRALQYLEQRMATNTIAGMNAPLEQLYLVELRERLLAHARAEYALETIDPANLPLFPYAPNRRMIAIIAAAVGGVLGVFVVLLLAAFRRPRADALTAA